MNFTENSDEITIRHAPVKDWIVGGILTSIIAFFLLWFAYSIFASRNGLPEVFLGDCGLVAIIGAGISFAFFEIKTITAPHVTITISQKIKAVNIILRRFYGSKTKRFYFTQIEKFKSYKGKMNFSPQYFLALVLANNKTMKLNIPIGNDKQDTIRLIKKLNKFIKLLEDSIQLEGSERVVEHRRF